MHSALNVPPQHDVLILRLVAFKWLMTGEGLRVDVPRLQADEAYAQECLRHGLHSQLRVVRHASLRLRHLLAH